MCVSCALCDSWILGIVRGRLAIVSVCPALCVVVGSSESCVVVSPLQSDFWLGIVGRNVESSPRLMLIFCGSHTSHIYVLILMFLSLYVATTGRQEKSTPSSRRP